MNYRVEKYTLRDHPTLPQAMISEKNHFKISENHIELTNMFSKKQNYQD